MKELVKVTKALGVRGKRDKGMATAEYAVGTVALVSLGGVLIKIFTDPVIREMIIQFITWLVNLIFDLMAKG